jgi:hypothetical protein
MSTRIDRASIGDTIGRSAFLRSIKLERKKNYLNLNSKFEVLMQQQQQKKEK